MDGLDALMASLSSSSRPAPGPSSNKPNDGVNVAKDASKQRQANSSSLGQVPPPGRQKLDGDLPERVVYFVSRLKEFQIRAANPSTRGELNKRLSQKSQDYAFTMQVTLLLSHPCVSACASLYFFCSTTTTGQSWLRTL